MLRAYLMFGRQKFPFGEGLLMIRGHLAEPWSIEKTFLTENKADEQTTAKFIKGLFKPLEFFAATRQKILAPTGARVWAFVEVNRYLHMPSFAEADVVNY